MNSVIGISTTTVFKILHFNWRSWTNTKFKKYNPFTFYLGQFINLELLNIF